MKKWMAVTGCILLLLGCAADPEQEKSGIPITNIQVENYFNLGENVQYFSKVPSRVLVIGAAASDDGTCIGSRAGFDHFRRIVVFKKSFGKHRVLERKRYSYFGVSEYNRTSQNKSAGNRGERNKIHP